MGTKAGRRTSSGRLFSAVTAVAMLAIGGLASGARLKTQSESVAIPDETAASAIPTCKQGEKIVSGGFESADFDPEFNEAAPLTYASFRSERRSWTASAQGFTETGTLIGYAYCRQGKGLKARSASAPVSGFDSATATASCKAGEKVVAGGYDIPDLDPETNRAFAYESRKDGKREWVVSAQSYDSDPATLTAYAYCREGKGVKTRSQTTSVPEPPETATVTATCKRRQRIVSGGFDSPGFTYTIDDVLPFVSRKQGARKWTVSAYNEGFQTGTLVAYAYCEKKKKK